jgi:hypothetical protein
LSDVVWFRAYNKEAITAKSVNLEEMAQGNVVCGVLV